MVEDQVNPNSLLTFLDQQFCQLPTCFIIVENVEFHADQSLRLFHLPENYFKGQVTVLQDQEGNSGVKGSFPDLLKRLSESTRFHIF